MGACVSMPASAAADLFDLPFRAATAASKLPPYRWWRAAGRPAGPGILPGWTRGAGSFGTNMAERAGFEPAVHPLEAYNRLAGDRFRPLSHLSAAGIPVISDKEAFFGETLPPGLSRRPPDPCSYADPLFPDARSGGGSRIRTRETFVQRFSRPPPSTTRPSLRCPHGPAFPSRQGRLC